jgi:hypothetical protein
MPAERDVRASEMPDARVAVRPASRPVPGLIGLQRSIGNRAVSQLVVQRRVRMYESAEAANKASKGTAFTGTETTLKTSDVTTRVDLAITALNGAGIVVSPAERTKMKDKLKEWIKKDARMAPSTAFMSAAFTFGESLNTGRAQDKRYHSDLSLGRALIGHIRSRAAKSAESRLSKKTRDSAYIKGKLRDVQRALFVAIEAITDDPLKQDVWSGMTGDRKKGAGEYYHWYKGAGDIKKMLRKGTGDFAQAISSIHDAYKVMLFHSGIKNSNAVKGVLPSWSTGDDFAGTVETTDPTDGSVTQSRAQIASGGYRANSTTVNEDNAWVQTARAHNVLLWAGPSHTTSDMMVLMRSLRTAVPAVDETHVEAVAWAIFAFWNKDFYTFKDGYHTFHEVMDVAKTFGVPYTPFSYPANPPSAANNVGTPVATTTVNDTED